ncbi:beta-defensin 113 [Saccopteryx bilineata]|uniref:beta-defensin 113 n=1 Tax=Saccopteryx bilineata TaxID=59482 RepID=UPI00338F17DF
MKILCIFLTFVFTVSCGPSGNKKKTKEITQRTMQCYLVRGACKTTCNTWEYVYNYCSIEPCCVIRDYIKPTIKYRTTTAVTSKTKVISSSTTLHNTTL